MGGTGNEQTEIHPVEIENLEVGGHSNEQTEIHPVEIENLEAGGHSNEQTEIHPVEFENPQVAQTPEINHNYSAYGDYSNLKTTDNQDFQPVSNQKNRRDYE